MDDVKGEMFKSAGDNGRDQPDNNNNDGGNHEADEVNDGDDGPDVTKVKSPSLNDAQTQGEPQTEDINVQHQGETSQALYIKPLKSLSVVTQANMEVVERVRRRRRSEEPEKTSEPLLIKKGKRMKRMAKGKSDKKPAKGASRLKGLTIKDFIRMGEEEEEEDEDDDDWSPACSSGSEELRDFDDDDDDDDDAPIRMILQKL